MVISTIRILAAKHMLVKVLVDIQQNTLIILLDHTQKNMLTVMLVLHKHTILIILVEAPLRNILEEVMKLTKEIIQTTISLI